MTGTDLCVNKSQFVPVIFEPLCSSINKYKFDVWYKKGGTIYCLAFMLGIEEDPCRIFSHSAGRPQAFVVFFSLLRQIPGIK
jgi:hypothetical protein